MIPSINSSLLIVGDVSDVKDIIHAKDTDQLTKGSVVVCVLVVQIAVRKRCVACMRKTSRAPQFGGL